MLIFIGQEIKETDLLTYINQVGQKLKECSCFEDAETRVYAVLCFRVKRSNFDLLLSE